MAPSCLREISVAMVTRETAFSFPGARQRVILVHVLSERTVLVKNRRLRAPHCA